MDRNQKKLLRERIGVHLDVSGTRLSDDEALELSEFIENYDSSYKGKSVTFRNRTTGFSSDGKYVRNEVSTYTFTDEMRIRKEYSYEDDDGQSDGTTTYIRDARGVLNWLRQNK